MDPPRLKRQNTQTTLLVIHHPKGDMINFLINHLWLVANFEGHIMNNDLLLAMIAAPGLIVIYVKILSWYGDHSIYQCGRCRRRLSWAFELEYLDFLCMWSVVVGGGSLTSVSRTRRSLRSAPNPSPHQNTIRVPTMRNLPNSSLPRPIPITSLISLTWD